MIRARVSALRLLVLPGLLCATRMAAGQSALVVRADSAFAAEDRVLARSLYEQVLRDNPSQAHAVFRLAQLEPSGRRALALYRRYSALEPQDPWGAMAEGDLLARMGRTADALAAYDRAAALAPGERDVAIGKARILARAGRSSDARAVLGDWTAGHPDDAEAWDLLGREERRAGRTRAAAASFGRAESLGGVPGAASRRRAAEAASAPAFEPVYGYQHDSDGNTTQMAGALVDAMLGEGTRAGLAGHVGQISDGVTPLHVTDMNVQLAARPTAALTLQAQVGGRQFAAAPGSAAWTTPEFDARLRWRRTGGPALDLRAQRIALGTAPLLVANQVSRAEGRATLEVPLGALRLRGTGRAAVMQAMGEAGNARLGVDGVLAVPLGGAVEWSAQYHSMSFQRASAAGYFAPRLAETVESGVYLELGDEGPLSIAADLGAGVQRIALQGENTGQWKGAYRGWTYIALALGHSRSLWSEIEAYDAPFAPEGAATSASWRFVSTKVGLRWSVR